MVAEVRAALILVRENGARMDLLPLDRLLKSNALGIVRLMGRQVVFRVPEAQAGGLVAVRLKNAQPFS